MFKLAIASLLVAATLAELPKPDFGLLSDEEIHYINNVAKTTWTAGRNFHPDDHAYVRRMVGNPSMKKSKDLIRGLPRKEFPESVSMEDLPVNFDAREKWPHCPSIREIRDQGNCISDWAVAAVSTMTDRICIASQGKINFRFSVMDVLTCCKTCGYRCQGGSHIEAWEYFKHEGIVSGGAWNSSQGCQPYQIKTCDHHVSGKLKPCNETPVVEPVCRRQCRQGYPKSYQDDKRFASKIYTIYGEEKIMRELVTNGPVEANFGVCTDFFHYKSGVYRYTSGMSMGNHAVKIIGYGVEKGSGTKYWLAANSWNTDWGDKGFFKIVRGIDECQIEDQIIAGIPEV